MLPLGMNFTFLNRGQPSVNGESWKLGSVERVHA